MNNHISFTIGIKGNISSVTLPNSQHRDTKQILQPTQEYFRNMFKPERIRKLPKLYYSCKDLYDLNWVIFSLSLIVGLCPSVLSSV